MFWLLEAVSPYIVRKTLRNLCYAADHTRGCSFICRHWHTTVFHTSHFQGSSGDFRSDIAFLRKVVCRCIIDEVEETAVGNAAAADQTPTTPSPRSRRRRWGGTPADAYVVGNNQETAESGV